MILVSSEEYEVMKEEGYANDDIIGKVGIEKAAEIALENVPGADADCIMEMDVDTEHGAIVYEIEIKYDGSKHEFEIDGATGKILKRSDEGAAN